MCEIVTLWSVQPKKLTVGCKSITGDAHDPKPTPFQSPNCSPHYGVQLVPPEAPTGELGIGELQPTEEPSHHHHQHGLRQCLSLFCWTTAQRPLKRHEVVVDISQIREANQSTYKLACLLNLPNQLHHTRCFVED